MKTTVINGHIEKLEGNIVFIRQQNGSLRKIIVNTEKAYDCFSKKFNDDNPFVSALCYFNKENEKVFVKFLNFLGDLQRKKSRLEGFKADNVATLAELEKNKAGY